MVLGNGESKDKALALNGSKVGKKAAAELKSSTALGLVPAAAMWQTPLGLCFGKGPLSQDRACQAAG